MVKDDQAAARIAEWKAIFDEVLKDAPWAPVFNEKRFTYHSERLGGDPVAVHRSDPYPGELRLHLRQGRAVSPNTTCAPPPRFGGRIPRGLPCTSTITRSMSTSAISAGTRTIRPSCRIAPGETVEFHPVDSSGGQLDSQVDRRRPRRARLRQGQSGGRARLCRGRRTRRCDQGDAARLRALGLGLDGEHPGLRPARRPVQGAGPAYLEV